MHDKPAEPGCGNCPNGRTCSTLRRLAQRDLGEYTVTQIARIAVAHRLDVEGVRWLLG